VAWQVRAGRGRGRARRRRHFGGRAADGNPCRCHFQGSRAHHDGNTTSSFVCSNLLSNLQHRHRNRMCQVRSSRQTLCTLARNLCNTISFSPNSSQPANWSSQHRNQNRLLWLSESIRGQAFHNTRPAFPDSSQPANLSSQHRNQSSVQWWLSLGIHGQASRNTKPSSLGSSRPANSRIQHRNRNSAQSL